MTVELYSAQKSPPRSCGADSQMNSIDGLLVDRSRRVRLGWSGNWSRRRRRRGRLGGAGGFGILQLLDLGQTPLGACHVDGVGGGRS